MRNEKDKGAKRQIGVPTPESIVESLINFEDPDNLRTHLREMIDAFLLSPHETDPDYRREIYTSFQIIDESLQQMETLNRRRKVA